LPLYLKIRRAEKEDQSSVIGYAPPRVSLPRTHGYAACRGASFDKRRKIAAERRRPLRKDVKRQQTENVIMCEALP
jgi:hypothetical protein